MLFGILLLFIALISLPAAGLIVGLEMIIKGNVILGIVVLLMSFIIIDKD